MKKLVLALQIILFSYVASAQTEPVSCARQAVIELRSMTMDQVTKLCSGATSTDPVKCAKAAFMDNYLRSITADQIVRLCAVPNSNR